MKSILNENGTWVARAAFAIPGELEDSEALRAMLAQSEGLCELIGLELRGVELDLEECDEVTLTVTGATTAKELVVKLEELSLLWNEIVDGYRAEELKRQMDEQKELQRVRSKIQSQVLQTNHKQAAAMNKVNKRREQRQRILGHFEQNNKRP
jgi:hypothetical protein